MKQYHILLLIALLGASATYAQDTLSIQDFNLDEVQVTQRRAARVKSRTTAIETEKLNREQLCTAACCNLAGSFENSASVDVNYSDAATGAQTIQLLGLSGKYVQLLHENTPGVRGLSEVLGLEFIPGPWMESIQISKGTSSVRNGYEALTGQINVEFLKPQLQAPLEVNLMMDDNVDVELNVTGGWKVDDYCSTGIAVLLKDQSLSKDDNNDGFIDDPKKHHLNLLNRWYIKKGDYTGQVLVHGVYDQRIGGQIEHVHDHVASPYIIDLRTRRVEAFVKNGYMFTPQMSIGIIASAAYHSQNHRYGTKPWDASQLNAYLNIIYQAALENEQLDPDDDHENQVAAGISVNYDKYNEQLNLLDLSRQETTPGIFAEYTYSYKDKLTLLGGIRADYSTRYGLFATPRLNIRYSPFEWWTLRGSVGLGYRSPNIVTDNMAYLASNKQWQGLQTSLAQEQALNTGATMTFHIPIAGRELQISGEYYYTRFLKGVLVDVDHNPMAVEFHNIADIPNAQSFAHAAQAEASMEVLKGWTWTLAFRYTDTRQTSWNTATNQYEVREKVLQNKFKGIISTSYQTPKKGWQFDLTAQFNGPARMPDGFNIPQGSKQYLTRTVNSHSVTYHKWFPLLMGQITHYFKDGSVYFGAENMTNMCQDQPIIGDRLNNSHYVNPWADNFDASAVWAPISGWGFYIGVRWGLEKKTDTCHDTHCHDHNHDTHCHDHNH